jgi:hypothetical protein
VDFGTSMVTSLINDVQWKAPGSYGVTFPSASSKANMRLRVDLIALSSGKG